MIPRALVALSLLVVGLLSSPVGAGAPAPTPAAPPTVEAAPPPVEPAPPPVEGTPPAVEALATPSIPTGLVLPGDLAVTGFAGSKLATDGIPPGVDPVERSIIDQDGATLRFFDFSQLASMPAGQLITPPTKLDIKAKDIGHVFAIAFDDQGGATPIDLYAAATSAFGLQIVGANANADGSPKRLMAGAAGARFMQGQFGGLPGAGPGTIFKIDGATGTPSLFANTDLNGVANSGAGISAIAIDSKSRSLFAADLDTGLIHRFTIGSGGASTAQFDHGSNGRTAAGRPPVADDGNRIDLSSAAFRSDDPATWAMTAQARRITALAVKDNRLFYAVAEGPEIWSLAIAADGAFGADARLETILKAATPSAVASIVFDAEGRMILGLRGVTKSPSNFGRFVEDRSGQVVRLEPAAAATGTTSAAERWTTVPAEFAIGNGDGFLGATGGTSLGHAIGTDGKIDLTQCNGLLAATGDLLLDTTSEERVAHGVQINDPDLVKPANAPPTQSAFLDFDSRLGNTDERGHVGAVLAIQRCDVPGVEGPPVMAGGPPVEGVGGPPVAGGPPIEGGAPPVDGGPPIADDMPSVDPALPNVAVTKTRSCSQPTPETLDCTFTIQAGDTGATPLDLTGAMIEDTFSTPPIAPVNAAGAEVTPTGLRFPAASGPLTFTSSFAVPPGGLVVENCARVTFPDGNPAVPADPNAAPLAVDPAQNAAPENAAPLTLAEQAKAKAKAKFEAQKAAKLPIVSPVGKPFCFKRSKDGRNVCTWELHLDNFSLLDNVKLKARTSLPSSEIRGVFETTTFDVTPSPGNSDFVVDAKVGAGAVTDAKIIAVFPPKVPGAPDPVLDLEVDPATLADAAKAAGTTIPPDPFKDDPNAPIDPIDPNAAAGVPPPAPGPGGAVADANPADNTSCVTFDTNNPNAPEVATNEPTLGDPGQGGPGGGPGPDGMAGDDGNPDAPPPPAADLSITKEQDCKPNGANKVACTFKFTVKNEGQADFVFGKDAVIDDVMTGAAASGPLKPVGNLPNVKATATGFSSLSGSTTVIPAGGPPQSFEVTGDFDVPPGGLKFENCATLKTEAAGTPVEHVPPPQDADLLDGPDVPRTPNLNGKADRGIRIEPQGPCLVRGAVKDCFFTVFMENRGDVAVPHGFKVDAGPNATSVVTDPAFNSVPPVTTNKAEFTNSQTLIEPGKSRSVTVRVTVPANSGAASLSAEVVNNVTAANQGEGTNSANDKAGPVQSAAVPEETIPPPLASGDSNPANNKDCKTFDSNAPPPKPKLVITKTGGAQCGKIVASKLWNCSWGIKVQNAGDTPFSGTFAFEEETSLPGTAQVVTVTGGTLACAPTLAAKKTCNGTANNLAPGASMEVNFETNTPFDALPVDTPKGNCKVSNKITTAADSPFGAQTTAPVESQLEIGKNLGQKIPCDPPALKLAKSAKGCTPSGSGFDCRYTLTVTSVGPDPFDGGTIEIKENIPAGATLKAETAGWNCDSGGLCKLGPTTLAIGASKALDVVMSVPKGNVNPGQCEIRNDAAIVQSGRDMASAVGAFKASASAKIDSPECNPKCYGGMVMTGSGVCACPPGQDFNTQRAKCLPLPTASCPDNWTGSYADKTCAPPLTGGTNSTLDVTSAPDKCTNGMTLNASGACACPSGSYWTGRTCLTRTSVSPPPPPPPGPSGGTNATSDPPPYCRGDRPVGTWPNCCPSDTYFVSATRTCRYDCPRGTTYRDGKCRAPVIADPGPKCDDACQCRKNGGRWTGRKCDYDVTCWDGSRASSYARCPSRPSVSGGTNNTKDTCDAACQCRKNGGRWNGRKCDYGAPPKVPCPAGWQGKYQPNCKPPAVNTCDAACQCRKAGGYLRGRTCIIGQVQQQKVPCPAGWQGRYQPNCRPPAVNTCDAACQCRKAGGYLRGRSCVYGLNQQQQGGGGASWRGRFRDSTIKAPQQQPALVPCKSYEIRGGDGKCYVNSGGVR